MATDYVTLKELAVEFGMARSNLRKYTLEVGFTPLKVRTQESRGQLTLALTPEVADSLREIRARQGFIAEKPVIPPDSGLGHFYIIQLIPELDPNRVKLGFTASVEKRLQQHKTAAPTASIVKAWPCKRTWEAAAMDSITRSGCQLLAPQSEVYTCAGLDSLVERAEVFFSLLPLLS